MDGKGRNVIVCDNGTGVRIFSEASGPERELLLTLLARPFLQFRRQKKVGEKLGDWMGGFPYSVPCVSSESGPSS